jgi:predicted dehydrogenase
MNRRTFLKSAAIAPVIAAAPAFLGAQDKTQTYTTALVGSGWWGTNILQHALAAGQAKLVALCDVDPAQIEKCKQAIAPRTSDTPKVYTDYRELLAKEKPQIVINATPDHWHALITIDAVAAGAHVYVEKPISHTILEGVAMVKASRAAERIVQVGTHRRVSPHNVSAREFLRAGNAGKIGMVKCFVFSGGGAEKPQPNDQPPPGMNWDLWCGPAPLRPFNRKIHTLGHRHFLDYANGQLGDWGIHWIDQAMWILDLEHPTTVFSTGGRRIKGRPVNSDAGQTSDAPDHQIATFAFGDLTMEWEHRQFAGNHMSKGESVGTIFYGAKGTFHLGWQSGWTFYPTDGSQAAHEPAKFSGVKNSENIAELWADFLDAIATNRRPISDIETGHRATVCALLGMLSLKLGRSIIWDGAKQTIPNDAQAAALLKRDYRGPWIYPQA